MSARLYRSEPEVQVLIHAQSPEEPKADALLVHGLEGSSDAGYMRSMAQTLLEAGVAVHRMNLRSCGGTDFLCQTLYHAGLTTDVFAYLMELDRQRRTPVYLIGFSLGGNIVLKLAGELGEGAHRMLAGVVSISTPLELEACARRLGERRNRLYEWRFVSSMKKRLKLRRKILPESWPWDRLDKIRTIYELDDLFTGPSFGFRGAPEYYATQSGARFLDDIRVPTVLIHAQDDPMIPWEAYAQPALRTNKHLRLMAVPHGGHIGFLARNLPRMWVDGVVRDMVLDLGNN